MEPSAGISRSTLRWCELKLEGGHGCPQTSSLHHLQQHGVSLHREAREEEAGKEASHLALGGACLRA